MAKSLIQFVAESVNPKDYYSWMLADLAWPAKGEGRIICPFHDDKDTPSLSINPENGKWFCHGCGEKGHGIISFHTKYTGKEEREAAEEIYVAFIRPIIPPDLIAEHHLALINAPTALAYVTRQRMISMETVEKYKLGYNGRRFVIPVKNEFGLYVNAKLYNPNPKGANDPKMLNFSPPDCWHENRPFGDPMLYPMSVLMALKAGETIVLAEGEWDTLLLLSLGVAAVTMTAGTKSWAEQYDKLFQGLKVVIAYDNDKEGTKYDRELVLPHLAPVAREVRRLEIPKLPMPSGKDTKDVTDWVRVTPALRNARGWRAAISKAKLLVDNPQQTELSSARAEFVPLDQASQARWMGKRIEVPAIITGKDNAPYILPRKARVSCNRREGCDGCPLQEAHAEWREVELDPTSPDVLRLIDAPSNTVRKYMLNLGGISAEPKCQGSVEPVESFNIEQLLLIPTLESGVSQYVMRSAYYIGHGLVSNRAYNFEGITTAHPSDQHATHLFDAAKAAQDEIETFTLTEEGKKALAVFRPKEGSSVLGHLYKIAEWQSRNITQIRERPDLHIAVDLVFHSVRSFTFNREYQRRGMLDALIIGDTRCGKGYVAEGLSRYYGLGDVASGENCTFAGLIGGLESVGKRFIVKWGLIPLNHGRLVVVDETSAIPIEEIARMSRVRSEGVAEISKIVREVTQANARLIWLSNPRSGMTMAKGYNYGVQAIPELIGANEDVARFDFALTVATNEVPAEIINSTIEESRHDANKYPRELARTLVLWAWSRKADQVVFTPEATARIIDQAISFGQQYSATIPLVQAENIRVKLAKVAAAVAARVFSSDQSGEVLIVDRQHVDCACQFLRTAYSKPSMGYEEYSRVSIETSQVARGTTGDKLFANLHDEARASAIKGLLELHRISSSALTDYIGDRASAELLIGNLVRRHCITRIENSGQYMKNPAFTEWLRNHQQELVHGPALPTRRVNGQPAAHRTAAGGVNGEADHRVAATRRLAGKHSSGRSNGLHRTPPRVRPADRHPRA